MKICAPQLGISPESILGGEIYDRQILKYLARQGHEIDIILPFGKSHSKTKNWKIHYLPTPFIVPPHLFNLLVLPQLFGLYKKSKFDLLRIHSPTYLGLAAWMFKKLYPQIPIVGIYHWLGEGGLAEEYINPIAVGTFDTIVCDSKYMKQQIENKYVLTKGKVYAIHNGVDEILKPMKNPLQLRRFLNIPSKTTVFVYMGLFIDRKNPLLLLELFKQLLQYNSDIALILCGKGPLKRKIEIKSKEVGLGEKIKTLPPVFGRHKNELLNAADIFVHPAKHEGFSLAVIEAMAVGLPVVMTAGYSAKEAVEDGVNGYLCKTNEEWINSLIMLINQPETRKKIGNTNIKKVNKQFRWEIVTKNHEKLFKSLINN